MRPTLPIVWLICWSVGSGVFLAQAADKGGAPATSTNAATSAPAPSLPGPQVFRELLGLNSTELDRALASIAEPARNRLRDKLREYAALAPDEREARLRATELRWYLVPLMRTPPTNRVAQLAFVPDECRSRVQERLEQWDALTPEIQQVIVKNEWMLRYFLQSRFLAASERATILS